MYLSKNFTLEEFIKSHVADKYNIPNQPDVINIRNIVYLANAILQPLRDRINSPLIISSGYRSFELNSHDEIDGVYDSHHLAFDRFAAADVKSKIYKPRQLLDIIHEMKLPVEQAIDEFGEWLHVSSCRPSMEYLQASKVASLKVYEVIKYAS
jgi:zinc D-Ala-D-Ala carboxypeptidase